MTSMAWNLHQVHHYLTPDHCMEPAQLPLAADKIDLDAMPAPENTRFDRGAASPQDEPKPHPMGSSLSDGTRAHDNDESQLEALEDGDGADPEAIEFQDELLDRISEGSTTSSQLQASFRLQENVQLPSSGSFTRTITDEISFNDDDGNCHPSPINALHTMSNDNAGADFHHPASSESDSSPESPFHRASELPQPAVQSYPNAQSTEEAIKRGGDSDDQQSLHESLVGAEVQDGLDTIDAMPGVSSGNTPHEIGAAIPSEGCFSSAVNISQSENPKDRGVVDPFADSNDGDDFFSQEFDVGSHLETQRHEDINTDQNPTPRASPQAEASILVSDMIPPNDEIRRSPDSTQTTSEQKLQDGHKASEQIVNGPDKRSSTEEDLASKWSQVFAGDDDVGSFLTDESAMEDVEVDATTFLGSDDEGFLEDDDILDAVPGPQPAPVWEKSTQAPFPDMSKSSQMVHRQQTNPYAPSNTTLTPSIASQPANTHLATLSPYGHDLQMRPELAKAESFADKSKGGYSSPFDLPTDLVKTTLRPRKRTQQPLREQGPPVPRTTSLQVQGSNVVTAGASDSSYLPQAPPLKQKMSAPALAKKDSFFEDLPLSAKPTPAPRVISRGQSPAQYAMAGQQIPLITAATKPLSPANSSTQVYTPHASNNLVAPARIDPYAAGSVPKPADPRSFGTTTHYSPAPAQHTDTLPNSETSRYSPAPALSRTSGSYGATAPAPSSQTVLQHLPRTSSPLAQFKATNDQTSGIASRMRNGDTPYADRRSSSSFDPRLNPRASLTPTREVDEEKLGTDTSFKPTVPSVAPSAQSLDPTRPKYFPQAREANSHMPSTVQATEAAVLSSNHPVPSGTPSRTYSPAPVLTNTSHYRVSSSIDLRPSSAHSSHASSQSKPTQAAQPQYTQGRARGQSLTLSVDLPKDGREQDPLERWRGVPIMTWGVGGTVVTSFPKSIPRYTMNRSTPKLMRTAGEVKVQSIKEIDPLKDRLVQFPGPLKAKSKKETLLWLAAGIEAQQKELMTFATNEESTLGKKRSIERLLLWKLLHVFIEFDGQLEGNASVEQSVREVLLPNNAPTQPLPDDNSFLNRSEGDQAASFASYLKPDGTDAAAADLIRNALLRGDRENAVWAAVDRRLWGHAMLLSHNVSADLYRRVAQEFVKKEVNFAGYSNESIAALYQVLSGNYDECVDELVPAHARAGLQLLTADASKPSTGTIDGLDKWRETLTLILSNRSAEDVRALSALGKLLSTYGRAEAAQICFLFSRGLSVFGGLDDYQTDFVLLGSDHRQQPEQFAKESEALQLSEIYEYGLSLASGASGVIAGAPHLSAYKLQHAVTLAEYGYSDKALQYCDAIASEVASQTKRSPYHHVVLEMALDDFMTRLKQAPREASSSWISRPSMNKVSDSVWNRFNKFVSGEDNADQSAGVIGDGENGPFARIVSTPNMNHSPSMTNLEQHNRYSPGHSTNQVPVVKKASSLSSRYAPVAPQPANIAKSQAPLTHYEAKVAPSNKSFAENDRRMSDHPHPGGRPSVASLSSNQSYDARASSDYSYQHVSHDRPAAQLSFQAHATSGAVPGNSHELPSTDNGPNVQQLVASQNFSMETSNSFANDTGMPLSLANQNAGELVFGDSVSPRGSEPDAYRSYSYEPPSYQPESQPQAESEDVTAKSKKKGVMYDEDDVPGLNSTGRDEASGDRAAKASRDRENEELFRKAAEDAKRAAAQTNKKGWGFSGWFSSSKKSDGGTADSSAGKPIRAKLGETSSFIYDPDLKRWINKKPGTENVEAPKATLPPPRAAPRSFSGTPRPPTSAPVEDGRSSVPPLSGPPDLRPGLNSKFSQESLGGVPPALSRLVSNPAFAAVGPPSGPPSRPPTSMSNASGIDDLLGASASRKAGQKKTKKSGRYIDIMTQKP